MKRILILLMLLALAGGLFAQVTFSGDVGSGVMIAIEDDTTAHAAASYDDWGAEQYAFGLYGSFTTPSGNAGADFEIYNYSGEIGLDGEAAYVWLKPIDMLTIYGGLLAASGFATPGANGTTNGVNDYITGVHLTLEPMSGLTFGAGFAPSGGELGDALYNFGVNYTLSGVVSAVANLRYDGSGNDGDGKTDAAFGFNILSLSGLGLSRLAIDASVVNITELDTAGQFIVGPRIGYSVGDLTTGLRARIYVPVRDDQELNVAAQVTGSYPVTDIITAGLGVGYSLKGVVEDTNGEPFHPGSWNSDALTRAYSDAESSVLVVNPYLSFDVFDGTINAGYSLQTQIGGESKTKHAVYVNFGVSF